MKVHSSNLDEAFYSHKRNYLIVVFKNGAVYSYENVPLEKWEEFKKAESKGSWFYHNIRNGGYDYEKLLDAEEPPVTGFEALKEEKEERKETENVS
jgi:hypothetical protein